MVNALVREGKELLPMYPPRGSMAAQLAFALPESTIVGAFHHLPASEMENLDSSLDADVVIFSDSDAASHPGRRDRQRDAGPARRHRGVDVARERRRGLYRCVHLGEHSPQGAQLRKARGAPLMQLYDSARQGIYPLEVGPVATLYSCGITPYDSAHLGHAFVYLAFDVLSRRLNDAGHEARCVRNVTDVDDDILRKARELGVNYLDLAAQEMVTFERDMKLINLLPVYSEPRATGAISEILSLIGATFDKGVAYEVDGNVYFEVSKFPRYGQVSHESRASMLDLAAIHGGKPDDPRKRDPLDFVLWQTVARRRAGVGVALGSRVDRAGTSSARRSRCANSARPSTSTAGARTSPFLTTSAKRPRAKR